MTYQLLWNRFAASQIPNSVSRLNVQTLKVRFYTLITNFRYARYKMRLCCCGDKLIACGSRLLEYFDTPGNVKSVLKNPQTTGKTCSIPITKRHRPELSSYKKY